jgi:HEPN domain-containing protein
MSSRAADWLRQSEDDAQWLADSIEDGHFAQACYIAQQVAEKALKSLAFARGASEVKGHSVTKIAQALAINSEIERAGRILDRYYISGRYPDAFPEGIPSDYLDREAALAAQSEALLVLNSVKKLMGELK